jgi:hypothetical protein
VTRYEHMLPRPGFADPFDRLSYRKGSPAKSNPVSDQLMGGSSDLDRNSDPAIRSTASDLDGIVEANGAMECSTDSRRNGT